MSKIDDYLYYHSEGCEAFIRESNECDCGRREAVQEVEELRSDNERMEANLMAIFAWCDAYPLDVFPEPDWEKSRELLKAGGQTIDCISAANMRNVVNGVRSLCENGLGIKP
jgi:hypothetical protein